MKSFILISIFSAAFISIYAKEIQGGIPDKFNIIWDGKDSYGSPLAAGIYFYSIQGENGNDKNGKIVLMK